jgi:hypothetical protein
MITITRRKHPAWLEWKNMPMHIKNSSRILSRSIIGQWQYIAKSPKGQISIVELPDYFRDGVTFWEIYSLKGKLFDDIERFNSYEDAEAAVRRYLE